MFIVVDIGGTKTRVARSRDLEALDQTVIVATPHDYRSGRDRLIALAQELGGGERVEALAIGAPGVISRNRRTLMHAPNLAGWDGAALVDDLQHVLGAPVILENDTAMVGLGEATVGAGRGATILAYVTVSTGVNGARIVDGVIDRAIFNFEIGEQILGTVLDAPTLEDLVSGHSIGERFGAPPESLAKDHPIWDELARIVAIGLHNTVAYWSPDRFVIGGSMMKEIGVSIDRIRSALLLLRRKNPTIPDIVHASLGDLGGLWGGLARLRNKR
ncbi:ROK family protein [Methylocystis sp. B8]|uniref:ROK family protein n=1 Tax=Methylocystis sp. B8 TaxID=544938 RepID=UPI0010FD115C|nr:ROK family protein [Methylocystis sp. B8]TLG77826.1 ROK family protein [Methylocystis sp. B8]